MACSIISAAFRRTSSLINSGKNFILINLKTSDLTKATRLCAQFSARDDVLWKALRSGLDRDLTTVETRAAAEALLASWGVQSGGIYGMYPDDPHLEGIRQYMESRHGDNYAYGGWFNIQKPDDTQTPIEHEAIRLLNETPETQRVFLSDALERYLSEHKNGQDIRFARDTRRAIGIVLQTVGDVPLPDYTRDHARAIRDALLPGHSSATVRRRLDSISAVFNLGKREFSLKGCENPFEKMQIQREGLDAKKRVPFTTDEINLISDACLKENDDIRWIVALQLATGARLGEIVGLRWEDVVLNCEIPHIIIRPHEALGRTLKTPGSERLVPLRGIGLWAVTAAMAAGGTGWLFSRYASDNNIRATHCSNTVNKWISGTLGIPKTSHSFRHAMKDRLRNAEVSEELAKALMGHGSRSVADSYGLGFTIQRNSEALAKLEPILGELKWLTSLSITKL